MKILHTSDWHLGKVFHEYSLIKDQESILDRILEHIGQIDYDALIIAGDIYDRSIPPQEAVTLLSNFILKVRNLRPDLPVLIISGNHDSAARLAFGSEVFDQAGIHIRTKPELVDQPVTIGKGDDQADVYMVPFLFPGTYSSRRQDSGASVNTHEGELKEALEMIRAVKKPDRFNILCGHLFTLGGEESDSERTFLGTAGHVSPKLFADFEYTALGHLHRPQKVASRAYYSGSLMKYSFSESSDKKSMLAVEIKDGETIVEKIPLTPEREVHRLKGAFADFYTGDQYDQHKDDFIEIEFTDADVVTNPIGLLKRKFPYLLSIKQNRSPRQSNGLQGRSLRTRPGPQEDFQAFYQFIHGEAPSDENYEIFNRVLKAEEFAEDSQE